MELAVLFKLLFKLVGGLGIFLLGMKYMSDGMQAVAGSRLRGMISIATNNRLLATGVGVVVTCIVQSSSITTVMVVGFVNSGVMQLAQALGVIMGANIGTTVTGWIVAILGFKFKIVTIALPTIGIGFPMLIIRRLKKQAWGEALVGLGLLLLGLAYLKHSVPDIKSNPELLEFLTGYTNMGFLSLLLFVLVGTLLTVVVQSSSAAMAITLTMAHAGWIDVYTAAAIVLGENIGTTITAFLASIGTQVNARRAARAHTLFNLLGVVWMLLLFKPFLNLVDGIVPGDMHTAEGITTHLAMFHTMFNIINTCVLVGFVTHLEKIVTKIVSVGEEEDIGAYSLKYLSSPLQDTGEINVLEAKMELAKMMGVLEKMFKSFLDLLGRPKDDVTADVEKLEKREQYTDQMQEQITQFLIECSRDDLKEASARNVNLMIRIANEMESIGDSCFTLGLLCQRRNHKNITLPRQALDDLAPYADLVQEFMTFTKGHLNEPLSDTLLSEAYNLENEIDRFRKKLKRTAQDRLQEGAEVKGELLYIDMLQYIEHIGDYCLNISEALRQYR